MKHHIRTWITISTLVVAATACGDGDEGACNGSAVGGGLLEGSYCSTTELTWTEVRIGLQSERFFSVEYVRPAGDGLEKALALLFDITLVVPNQNQQISFLGASGQVTRIVSGSSPQNLTPQLDPTRSTLTFTEPYQGQIGSRVEGEFALFFESNGRTLRGEFEGELTDPADRAGQ